MISLLILKLIGFGLIIFNIFLFVDWLKPNPIYEPIVYEDDQSIPKVKPYW